MSEVIVAKAGGTSNANPEAVEESLGWADQSDIFIVSAPGVLPGYSGPADALEVGNKVTNLSLIARDLYLRGDDMRVAAELIQQRFAPMRELGGCALTGRWVDDIPARVEQAVRYSKHTASMLGEQLQAEVYAAMGFNLLDPGRAQHDLKDDLDEWRAWLSGEFTKGNHYVLPGNITRDNGQLVTFDRGGSDISWGMAAYGVRADMGWNLTDGQAMSADPRLIDKDRLTPIDHMPYIVARELGRSGTGLVHAAAMVPLMIGDIPTEVRSTFDGTQPPTKLDNDYERASSHAGQVLALSLMRKMDVLQIHEPGMAEAVGRLAAFDHVLANAGIPLIDSQGAGVDAQRFYVSASHGAAALEALRAVVRRGGDVRTREYNVDLVTMAGFELERELLNIQEIMRNAGILGNGWQAQRHDLSHGNHGIRISVDPGQGESVLDQLHQNFIEHR